MTHTASKNFQQFANCPYLSQTKTVAVANRICEDGLHFNVWQNLFIRKVLITRKRKLKHRICIQMTAYFIPILLYIFTGMRFALMQVKTGLCHILSRFEVAQHRNTPKRIAFDTKSFLLTVGGELPLNFIPVQL